MMTATSAISGRWPIPDAAVQAIAGGCNAVELARRMSR